MLKKTTFDFLRATEPGRSSAERLTIAERAAMASPEDRIRSEVEEETGFRITHVQKVFEAFTSPGSETERLYFFVAEYTNDSKAAPGGGNHAEGEDIEVLELSIEDAVKAIESGDIVDGKTILL